MKMRRVYWFVLLVVLIAIQTLTGYIAIHVIYQLKAVVLWWILCAVFGYVYGFIIFYKLM